MPSLAEMAEEAAGQPNKLAPGEIPFEPLALLARRPHLQRLAPQPEQKPARPSRRPSIMSNIGTGLGLFGTSARKPPSFLG